MLSVQEKVDRVFLALNYAEENLLSSISNEEMAHESFCSLYHFQEVFKAVTGFSPADYIRRRRLTLAADEVLETKRSLQSIAFEFGYESLSTFSRAFSRQYEISPGKYRRQGMHYWFHDTQAFEESQLLFYNDGLQRLPEFRFEGPGVLAGVSDKTSYCEQMNPDRYRQMRNKMHRGCNETDIELISRSAGLEDVLEFSNRTGFFCSVEALAVDAQTPELLEMPRQLYAVFSHKGSFEELNWTSHWIWIKWQYGGAPEIDYFAPVRVRSRDPEKSLFDNDLDLEIMIPVKALPKNLEKIL